MKRFVLIGLLLAGMGSAANAQTDDIYATGRDQSNDSSHNRKSHYYDNGYNQNNSSSGNYDSPGDYNQGNNSYGDEYVDYDDDYTYSSRIRRFDDPFYNMG